MLGLFNGLTQLLIGIVVVVAFLYHFILYPIFFSPLSKVPSIHPLAPITSLWIQWQRFRGNEFNCITNAFVQKGDYIRVGPNELIVNDVEAVRSAWGIGINNFDKHKQYEHFMNQGQRNMFSSLGKDHEVRKRQFSAVYKRSYVQTSAHFRTIVRTLLIDRLLPSFKHTASGDKTSMNMLPMTISYSIDFITAFEWGLSRGTNMIQDETERKWFLDNYILANPSRSMYWLLEQPGLAKVLDKLGFDILPQGHYGGQKAFDDWSDRKVEAAEKAIQESLRTGKALPDGDLPIVYESIRASMAQLAGSDKGFVPNSDQMSYMASETFDHCVAVRDAFGTVLTYIIYEISRRPDFQIRLRKELHSIEEPFRYPAEPSSDRDGMPSPTALAALPLLNGAIKEGLRLRNTTPNTDPRMTPPGRNSKVGHLENLPPGIRIGAYAWCIHRRADMFPDPEEWIPERWLKDDGSGEAKGGWFFAFGGGQRACIGQQIAWELLRYAVAGIYTNFSTSVADESKYPGANKFVSGDCTEELFIQIKPLDVCEQE